MEITINGKRIVLREKLPARENWDFFQKMNFPQGTDLTFEQAVGLAQRYIKEWDFEGDPTDVESYADMDLPSELLPIINAVTARLNEALGTSKN